MAIVLCIAGGLFLRGDGISAVAAERPSKVSLTITNGASMMPGDTIEMDVEISSTMSGTWKSVDLCVAPVNVNSDTGNATVNADLCQYFEFLKNDATCEDEDFDWDYSPMYVDSFSKGKGATLAAALGMGGSPIEASRKIVFKFKIKIKDSAPDNLKDVTFGVPSLKAYAFAYSVGSKTEKHQADQAYTGAAAGTYPDGVFEVKTCSVYIGQISSDNTLKSVEGGINASSKSAITVADNMTASAEGTGYSYVLNAVVNDTAATLKWGVGTSATTAVNSGTDFTVTLSNTGETTVTIEVTAEDNSKKNYTIVIKSAYAALDLTAANVTLNGSSGSFGLDNTTNTTLAHVINIPSDCTEAKLKPTIVANYGMSTDIAVATTGCTASPASTITSGSQLTITDIAEGNSFTLTVTAKSGDTAVYTFTFKVASVDTSISSISMTESVTSATVNNDESKATANSVDYYFLLSEDSGFKGKFNITTTASGATVKINGSAYSNTTEYNAGTTYTITVTAEAGNTKDYKAMVAQDLKTGDIKNMQYALISQSSWNDVLTPVSGTLEVTTTTSGTTTTHSIVIILDPSTYANKVMYLQGTIPPGLGSISLNGITGTTAATAGTGNWNKTLAKGTNNKFSITATNTVGSTVYSFDVRLIENKNAITGIQVLKNGTSTVLNFTPNFDQGTYTYNLDLEYSGYDKVDFKVTTEGQYAVVYAEVGVAKNKFTTSAPSNNHTLTNIACAAGSQTTVLIYAYSDGIEDPAYMGTPYTIKIMREGPDNDASLLDIVVEIGGTPYDFLEGSFDTNTLSYNIEFTATVSSPAQVKIYAKPSSKKATIKLGSTTLTAASGNYTGYFTTTQSFTFSQGQEKTETYTLTVTPQEGSPLNYTVKVKKIVPPPQFDDLQIAFKSESGYTDVFSSAEFDSATNTYTVRKNINDVNVNDRVYIKGTKSAESSVTPTGLTNKADNSGWYANLVFGLNTYSLKVVTGSNNVTYTFKITLAEDLFDITNVTIKNSDGDDADSSFSFSPGTSNYTLNVPFKGYDSVTMTVTTDGFYTKVLNDKGVTVTSSLTTKDHTLTINLTAGGTYKIVVYTKANDGAGDEGTRYTFEIKRGTADSNNNLDSLEVVIDGQTFIDPATFNPNTTSYTYNIQNVGYDVPLDFTATTKSELATMTFKVTVTPGTSSFPTSAEEDMYNGTTISKVFSFLNESYTVNYIITIKAESGASKAYTISIKRTLTKGELTGFEVSSDGGNYDDVFGSFTGAGTSKTLNLSYDIADMPVGSSLYVNAASSADTTVTVTGASGSDGSYEIQLTKFGVNTAVFTATTALGTTTYTVNVTLYENIDGIDDIELETSTGDYVDGYYFDANTKTYTLSVPFGVSSVKIKVTPLGEFNYIYSGTKVLDKDNADGTYYIEVSLKAGASTTTVVNGKANEGKGQYDKTTQKYDNKVGTAYTFTIERGAADKNVTLDSLTVYIDGEPYEFVEGAFDPNQNKYTIELDDMGSKTSADVSFDLETSTPTSSATVKNAKGVTVTSSDTFTFDPTKESSTTYTITVTAQDGSTNTYTVTVKNKIPEGDFTTLQFADAGLQNFEDILTSSRYDSFDNTYYVDYSLENVKIGASVTINAIATVGATITATSATSERFATSGSKYSIKLVHGVNKYTFTAKSSGGEHTYYIVINLYEDLNSIEDITIKAGNSTLSSDLFSFESWKTEYEFTVPNSVSSLSFAVKTDAKYGWVEQDGTKLTIGGAAGSANAQNHTISKPVALVAGQTITLRFVAISDRGESGTTYEIKITRERGANSGPNVSLSIGNNFNEQLDTNSDETSVYVLDDCAYDEDSLPINVDFTNGGTYSVTRVKADGQTSSVFNKVNSGTGKNIPLEYGTNVFNIEFTAADGSTTTAVVVVEREYPYFESLSAVEISSLRRDYDPNLDAYAYQVDGSVSTLTLDYDYDTSKLRCKVEGPSQLEYGENVITLKLYDKNDRNYTNPLKTVTITVIRGTQSTGNGLSGLFGGGFDSFWLILVGILAAIIAALIIILIVVRNRSNNDNNEPEVIVTNATQPTVQQQQPTIIIQNPPDYY